MCVCGVLNVSGTCTTLVLYVHKRVMRRKISSLLKIILLYVLLISFSLFLCFCDMSCCTLRTYVCLSVHLCWCMRLSVCCVSFSGNKRVSFEEFLPIFLSGQQKKDSGSMEDFIEGLRVFDKDGNGFINSAELRHVLTSLGKSKFCTPPPPLGVPK